MVRALACLALAAALPIAARAQAPAATRPVWTPIVRTTAVTASFDTTRLRRSGPGAARLWYRFAYATPLVLGADSGSRFAATEFLMDVDCRAQRARTITLRMESLEGIQADVPASDSSWRTFAAHPMGAGIFVPACAALGMPMPAAPTSAPPAASAAKP